MKSAEMWQLETREIGKSKIPLINQIQKDALLYEAEMVHQISRGTKSEERSMAIDEARDALIWESEEI
jgi:hypothetical protein